MEFKVPSFGKKYRIYEECPKCKTKVLITNKKVVIDNLEIECPICGNKWKLDINKEK